MGAADPKTVLRSGLIDRAFKLGRGWHRNGLRCNWILDCREILLDSVYLSSASAALWELIEDLQPDAVAGKGVAASPLVAALVRDAGARETELRGLLIREEKKQYGLRKHIEGPALPKGSRVVVVDDVANSGGTLQRAARLLTEAGYAVVGAAVLLEFEPRARKRLEQADIPLFSVFRLSELGLGRRAVSPTLELDSVAEWVYAPGNELPYVVPHSSPVVADDRVVFGTDTGCVVALSLKGEECWRTTLGRGDTAAPAVYSTPCVHDEAVFVGADDGCLYRLSLEDGAVDWRLRCGELIGSSPTVSVGSSVVVEVVLGGDSGALVSVTHDGRIAWRHPLAAYAHASPAVDLERDVAVAADNGGHVHGVRAATGENVWSYRTASPVKGRIVSEHGGCCLVASFAGYLHCLDTATGDLRWARKLSGRFFGAPLVVDHTVVIGGGSHLVAVDIESGEVIWWLRLGGRVRGGVTRLADGRFAVGCGDGSILVGDLETGRVLYCVRATGPVLSSVAASDDGLLIASVADGRVAAFRDLTAQRLVAQAQPE